MRALVATIALVAAILGLPSIGWAAPGPDTLAARVADAVAAMQGTRPAADVFSGEFLKSVPEEHLARLAADLQAANGKLTGFDELKPSGPTMARFLIRFERATAEASIQIESDEPHKVAGFLISSVTPLDDGPQKLLADFAGLPGRSGFAIVRLSNRGASPVLTLHPAEQFAIGSAFKLWVLDALASEIERGRLRWTQVVPVGPRSLPSGMTQNWPRGSPITVHTLAVLMISISDNTATDTLIRLIGRERLEASLARSGHAQPSRNRPFLTTAESFAIKARPADFAERYAARNEAGKRRMLATLPGGWQPGPERDAVSAALTAGKPLAIDTAEWFASPDDVGHVLNALRRRKDPRVREILAIAPHMPGTMQRRFAFTGYKGGSETGVINLSWLLRTKSAEWYAVTASWNDAAAPVDNNRFEGLAQRLIGLIR